VIKCSVYKLLAPFKGERGTAKRKIALPRDDKKTSPPSRREDIMSSFFYNHEKKKSEIAKRKK